jgi:hypothetical protein
VGFRVAAGGLLREGGGRFIVLEVSCRPEAEVSQGGFYKAL